MLGCAPGYTIEEATKPALALGIAFQITNILRDVGEDALRDQAAPIVRLVPVPRFGRECPVVSVSVSRALLCFASDTRF